MPSHSLSNLPVLTITSRHIDVPQFGCLNHSWPTLMSPSLDSRAGKSGSATLARAPPTIEVRSCRCARTEQGPRSTAPNAWPGVGVYNWGNATYQEFEDGSDVPLAA